MRKSLGILSTKHVNLSIQSVILFNARVVLSTQCLIMLKDYKRLCHHVKTLGYLVCETCELVYTICYYANRCVILCT